MMQIKIYTPDLRPAGICDCPGALRAESRFCRAGSLTLTAAEAEANRFAVHSLIAVPGMDELYTVTEIRTDMAEGSTRIRGESVTGLFSRRVIPEPTDFAGAAQDLLISLAGQYGQAVLPAELRTVRGEGSTPVELRLEAGDLLSRMGAVCRAADLGFTLGEEGGAFVFTVRPRREAPLHLSRSAGNLVHLTRHLDFGGYRNRAIVRGADGTTVTLDAAGLFSDGVDDSAQPLREVFVRAADVLPGEYGGAEAYRAALASRGEQVLAGCRPSRALAVETDTRTAAVLTPGDRVYVREIGGEAFCRRKWMEASGDGAGGVRYGVELEA